MRAGVLRAASVAAACVVVLGLLWWGTQETGTGPPRTGVARYLPAGGVRSVEHDPDRDETYVTENAVLTGDQALLATPPLIANAVRKVLAGELDGDPESWTLWRTVTTDYAASADSPEQTTTLRVVSGRGIEQVADYGAFALVFTPSLLELPAGVHDGASWSGTGTARPDGSIDYVSHLSAAAASGGCYRVTGDVDTSEKGQELLDLPIDELFCPGRGLRSSAPADRPSPSVATTPTPGTVSAADVAAWQVTERPVVVADSVREARRKGGVAHVLVAGQPVARADGGLALTTTASQDVYGLTPASGALVRGWVAHPGGTVTSLGSAGQVTVVGSTTRELSGYGPWGAWLWDRRLDDVVVAPPVAVDADHLVAATLSGQVVGLDPATGARRWQVAMSDQVRVQPATDGQHVAVGDAAGEVVLLDAGTGRKRWSADGSTVQAVGIVGGTVVVLDQQTIQGYRLSDGALLWSHGTDGELDGAVLGLDGVAVVATSDATLALDARTGAVRWRADGADATVGVGDDVVVQVRGTGATARDRDGQLLGRWALSGLTGQVWLTASADGAYATDGLGHTVAVGP